MFYNIIVENLFEMTAKNNSPLAERMRPNNFDDFVGQQHIVGKGSLLRRAILTDSLGSCIFYGEPGCGKTTLANIIASTTKSNFVKLNAVSSGVAEAKKIIEDAKHQMQLYGKKTYLILDECHRWNKAQSDCMLSAIEQGHIIFIGSTTENPFVSMTKAIVSRCRIFEFKKITAQDQKIVIKRALKDKEYGLGHYDISISDNAIDKIIWASSGDVRSALNSLELAVLSTSPNADNKIIIDESIAQQSSQKRILSVDENMYYNMISAFCKSLRGSDSDSAIYWAERLLQSGCDPMLIARRLVVHSSEDVGMADPQALVIATSAMYALQNIGLPEAKIPLANAIIYICEAPKSNSVYIALAKASELVSQYSDDNIPIHLQEKRYNLNNVQEYKYPHDYGGWVEQQYLPDSLKDYKLYIPSNNGFEKNIFRAKIQKRPKP